MSAGSSAPRVGEELRSTLAVSVIWAVVACVVRLGRNVGVIVLRRNSDVHFVPGDTARHGYEEPVEGIGILTSQKLTSPDYGIFGTCEIQSGSRKWEPRHCLKHQAPLSSKYWSHIILDECEQGCRCITARVLHA